jgi:hypothetical protein
MNGHFCVPATATLRAFSLGPKFMVAFGALNLISNLQHLKRKCTNAHSQLLSDYRTVRPYLTLLVNVEDSLFYSHCDKAPYSFLEKNKIKRQKSAKNSAGNLCHRTVEFWFNLFSGLQAFNPTISQWLSLAIYRMCECIAQIIKK